MTARKIDILYLCSRCLDQLRSHISTQLLISEEQMVIMYLNTYLTGINICGHVTAFIKERPQF